MPLRGKRSLKYFKKGLKRCTLFFAVNILLSAVLCFSASALTYQDYPYSQAAGSYVADAWNFYQCECTSYVAWCLNNRNGISFHNQYKPGTSERLPSSIAAQYPDGSWYYGRWGNANNWKNAAEQCGFTVDSTPAVGAVFWTWNGSYTSTGHVAWVSAVNGDQVTIEQYNAGWVVIAGEYHGNHKFSSETFTKGSRGEKYIHFKDVPTNFELDVNGWTDGVENGSVANFATFDVYINGSRVADDVNDYCATHPAGSSYEIKDIKVASGKAFDGYSNVTRPGHTSGGRTGTLNSHTDVRLQLHTVDAAAFDRKWVPTDVTAYNGHSYFFYNVPVTWYDGAIISEYLGGHLVTITSEAENHFVKEFIGASNLWLGATDRDKEGTWKWISGETFSFSDWGSGQPDNDAGGAEGSENYAHIWASSGSWNDNNGNVQYPFVCEIDRAYTVSYDSNGGSSLESQAKAVGRSITIHSTVPTRAGFTFQGWQGDKVYQPGDAYSLDQDMTLTAIWKSNQYTVSYDANGGANPPSSVTVNDGPTMISTAVPTRAHYVFVGWASTPDVEEAEYAPGDQYSACIDVTLYAVWQRSLENLMILPDALTTIESEAFADIKADAVVIPRTVTKIETDAFNTDIAIYGYTGTEAESYANRNHMFFVPIAEDWVPAEEVPTGAKVIDQKWTYLLTSTETMKSTETSVEGWIRTGYEWKQTGMGTNIYASFPGGFDTGNALYTSYAKSAMSASETETGKREVSGSTLKDYIYWHWTFTDYVADENRNVTIEDSRKLGVNISGSVYRDFIYFDAFETAVSLNPEGMATSGLRTFDGLYSTYHHPEYNLPEYASWWWYRFEVYQQSYTDYQKEYTYTKDTSSILESSTEVYEGDGISEVRHWVKYKY